MPDSPLAGLDVRASDVAAVEHSVLATAEANASKAEAEERARLLRDHDTQLSALLKQERILSAGRFSTHANRQIKAVRARIDTIKAKRKRIIEAAQARDEIRDRGQEGRGKDPAGTVVHKEEGERDTDFLIRTGKLTPFEAQNPGATQARNPVRRRRTKLGDVEFSAPVAGVDGTVFPPHVESADASASDGNVDPVTLPTSSGRYRAGPIAAEQPSLIASEGESDGVHPETSAARAKPVAKRRRPTSDSGSGGDEYKPDESDDSLADELEWKPEGAKKRKRSPNSASFHDIVDDADDEIPGRSDTPEVDEGPQLPEGDDWKLDSTEEIELDGGIRIPASIYDKLFDYQKTGVSRCCR
ncbi:unnamed protein product [Chondrus crispus]|uniref:Uncharacterized protein n=1 Tax=Chondrus crispus TaxID=2769 RepID=R7QAS9_CHOCR|nr:unnamed protein product [Chondrus crispus]CDF35179.1 unnamed protein product [Chondrus crispus]|eukprot:XP_005714999.1 unnamed protein product [Chondrus crispus]